MVALQNDNSLSSLNSDISLVFNNIKNDVKKNHITVKLDISLFKIYFKLQRLENILEKQVLSQELMLNVVDLEKLKEAMIAADFSFEEGYDTYMEIESLESYLVYLNKKNISRFSINLTIKKLNSILDKNAQCINYLGLIESKLLSA